MTLKWQKLSSTPLSRQKACHGLPAHHTPFQGLVLPDLPGSRTPSPDSWDYEPRCAEEEIQTQRGHTPALTHFICQAAFPPGRSISALVHRSTACRKCIFHSPQDTAVREREHRVFCLVGLPLPLRGGAGESQKRLRNEPGHLG